MEGALTTVYWVAEGEEASGEIDDAAREPARMRLDRYRWTADNLARDTFGDSARSASDAH